MEHATESLSHRICKYNSTSRQQTSIYHLRKLYKLKGIRKKKLKRYNNNLRKYPEDVQHQWLLKMQQQLLKYDRLGWNIYQIDETIYDARQHVSTAWSLPNDPIMIKQVDYRLNKFCAAQVAICSTTGKVFSQFKSGYFNQDDTQSLLIRIMKYHRHQKVCIFWDNASVHTGKKMLEFFNRNLRLAHVENLPYNPETNGIETLFAFLKKQFYKSLTIKKLLFQDFDTHVIAKLLHS